MKNLSLLLFAFMVLSLTLVSCNKDDDQETAPVVLEFDHIWGTGNDAFAMEQDLLHPRIQETLHFTTMKYYISNVRLRKADGSWYEMPESCFLLDLSAAKGNEAVVPDVPSGEYTAVEILMGVDSTLNFSGAQTGALDPNNGMFWSWNSGYIMLKAEGTSPQSSDGSFAFHLGGFAGDNRIQKKRTFEFNETLKVQEGRKPVIHFMANVARLWHNGEKISDISKRHMPGELAQRMAHGFYDGIQFDHIHN